MKLEELRDMFRKGEPLSELIPEPVETETGGTIYSYSARAKNDHTAIGEGTPYYEACKVVGFGKGEGLDAVKVWFEKEASNYMCDPCDVTIGVISEIVYDTGDSIRHLLLVAVDGKGVAVSAYSIIDVYIDAESRKLTCSVIPSHSYEHSANSDFDKARASIVANGYDIIRTQGWSR